MKSATPASATAMRDRQRAFETVERVTDLPMIVLSLAFVPIILIPWFVNLSSGASSALETAGWVIWAAFAMELGVKTYLAPRRTQYLIHNWFDVLIVVLPFLRPLRVVRSARLLWILRASRAGTLVAKVIANGQQILTRYGLHYGLAVGVVVILACASLVFYFERRAGGPIDDIGTAFWWAATTVTTVGYGDTFPTTPEGRGLAVLMMLVGITLFGMLTASVAAFFIESDKPTTTLDDIMAKLDEIERRLDTAELRRPE